MAIERADDGAGRGGGRALLLGQVGLRQLGVLVVGLLAGCSGGAAVEPGRSALVVRVVDGDTVVLSGLGKTRLIGVDTPEVYGGAECYGREASGFARRTLRPGRRVDVRVGVESRDRYGRVLAYVFVSERRTFNEDLVARGYARPLTIAPNDELAGRLEEAARRARAEGRGLWGRACAGASSPHYVRERRPH